MSVHLYCTCNTAKDATFVHFRVGSLSKPRLPLDGFFTFDLEMLPESDLGLASLEYVVARGKGGHHHGLSARRRDRKTI